MKENNTSPLLICIGRQLGSGGLSVAKLLARNLVASSTTRNSSIWPPKKADSRRNSLSRTTSRRVSSSRSSICMRPTLATITSTRAASLKTAFSNFRAMPSARQPKRDLASSWAVVPTMCYATSPICSASSSRPTSRNASKPFATDVNATSRPHGKSSPTRKAHGLRSTISTPGRSGDKPTPTTSASTPLIWASSRRQNSSASSSSDTNKTQHTHTKNSSTKQQIRT